jgi:hypothetical protein
VLVGFFVGNDTYTQIAGVSDLGTAISGRRVSRSTSLGSLAFLKILIYKNSHLGRLAMGLRSRYSALAKPRENCSDFPKQYLAIQQSRLINHLKASEIQEDWAWHNVRQMKRIHDLVSQSSGRFIVVLIPDENQINNSLQQVLLTEDSLGKYDFDMPQKRLEAMFSDLGIPVIDLLPYFKRDPRCLYMNDTHWTPEGHKLAASVLFEHIFESNIKLKLVSSDHLKES